MRRSVVQTQPQKPAVGSVYPDLLYRLTHAPDPEHILYDRKLDQYDRVQAGAAVIFAIAVFHHFIDEAPVNGIFKFTHKVVFRHQLIQAGKLKLPPVLSSVSCHHTPRPPLLLFYHTIVAIGTAFALPMATLSTG